MKASLKKLRSLALHHRHDSKDRRDHHSSAQRDELAQASQDMQSMRDCYDSLISAAAATANSAYEFSESLREMGTCLLEKTGLGHDEASGKVLLMLGQVQFELQKLVDNYRSHVFQTITIPSESLLNQLQTVEEMKRQCDEKGNLYDHMITRHKDKGKSKSEKGETFSSHQLKAAQDEYDEEATLFIFRLKSLKQGQSRSLLTQAARHHAAQLSFFKKALRSLEAVDQQVKVVAEKQHIDYQFAGLEDDNEEGIDDSDGSGHEENHDGELSFDYGQNSRIHPTFPSRSLREELNLTDITFPQVAGAENCWEIPDNGQVSSLNKTSSQSAPLYPGKKPDPPERTRHIQPSPKKFNAYVLPTPAKKNPVTTEAASPTRPRNSWHSSPLEHKKPTQILDDRRYSTTSVLRETNGITTTHRPLPESLSSLQLNTSTMSHPTKLRHAFSGPLIGSSRSLGPQNPDPRKSPNASPSFVSSPKITELHELPLPPAPPRSTRAGHSAPLFPGGPTSRVKSAPLPVPPHALTRSFSIPSSNHSKADLSSPPLTPVSLANIRRASSAEATLSSSRQGRGIGYTSTNFPS